MSDVRPNVSVRLTRALAGARLRWWRTAVTRSSWVAVVAGLGAVVVTWPVRWLTGATGTAWNPDNLVPTLLVCGATSATAAVAAIAVHAVRAPTLLDVARRCDRLLGLDQRLSTAFEVVRRDGVHPKALVARLLLADVEARLDHLDLRPVMQGGAVRGATTTLVGLGVAASVAWAVPVPVARSVPPVSPVEASVPLAQPTFVPSDVDATVALAETVARQLAEETATQRDPFLRAVAEGFAELAVQLRDESIDVTEADAVVADLLSLLQDAAQRSGGSLDDVVREAMPEGIDRGRGEDSNASVPSFGSETVEGEEGEGRSLPEGGPTRREGMEASGVSALERLADALERRAEERAARAPQGPTDSFGSDGRTPYGEQINVARERSGDAAAGDEPLMRAQGAGGGQAAGAAQQSSSAAGDAAGRGSAELNGDPADFERADATVDLTPVDTGEESDGTRIESNFAPTEGDVVRQVTEAPPARAFDRSDETGTPSTTILWTHRDVVRRYFLPDDARSPATTP